MKNSASEDDSSQEVSSSQTRRGADVLQAVTVVPRLYADSAGLTAMSLSVTVWRSVHSGAGMLVEVAHRLQVQRQPCFPVELTHRAAFQNLPRSIRD